ncbi:MAG: DNA translocase FtsK 4TM domain-containing protein, partial [Bacteroidota bacterium]|nr:DNA translocase FtsK 4TM domain-containing protein [Bacteroidota bacterium]
MFGLFLVLASAYLLVAFISFLFTWRVDQDLVGRSWSEIFSPEVHVENWLGKLGALIAHQFIYKWFGIAAFALVLWSFIGGVRILLGSWLLPPRRTFGWTAMALLWMPALLGFFFRDELMFLGGGVGFLITKHLSGLLGTFGTGALIVFALVAFATFTFNPSFDRISNALARLKTKTEEEEEEEMLVDRSIVDEVHSAQGVRVRSTVQPELEHVDAAEVSVPFEADQVAAIDTDEESEAIALEAIVQLTKPVPSTELELENSPFGEAPHMVVSSDDEGFSIEVPAAEPILSDDQLDEKLKEFGEYDPTLDLSSYELPPIDLLQDHGTGEVTVTKEELELNKDRIVETLGHYNIGIDKIKATIGPTVTLYEIIPKAGVRISKIKNLEDDIALSLAALGIRIIAPIPGK